MSALSPINPTASGRGVTAVLGPTNTGKTHLAIERMAAHSSGLIGLPLRLLAREVYQRLCSKVGVANVALITGEEKINPKNARYQVCTVEAMPSETSGTFEDACQEIVKIPPQTKKSRNVCVFYESNNLGKD